MGKNQIFKKFQKIFKSVSHSSHQVIGHADDSQGGSGGGDVGAYIAPIKILYFFHSTLFVSPVRLVYEGDLGQFILKPCNPLQRMICFLVLCLTSLSILNNIKGAGQALLSDTGYIVSYFDFVNFLVVTGFIYIHMYIHWFRLDLLNAWVMKLQKSPLVQFSTLSLWKAKLFGRFILILSLYLTAVWMLTLLGLDFSQSHRLYDSSESVARQLFWLHEGQEVGPTLRILTIFARLYDAIYVHIPFNAFIPIQQFCCYHLAADFLNAIRHRKIQSDDILGLYAEYKCVLGSINSFFGPYSFLCVFTALSFHSVHLLDVLNTPWTNWTWKVNMYIYVCFLLSWFAFPTKTFMKAKNIKKWLWEQAHYMAIPVGQLKLMLYDLSNNTLGLGGGRFFVLSPSFTGQVFQLLLTYCLLNLQTR